MADALFTINDDDGDHGYDAEAEEVLTLRLKTLPVSGVNSVRFQVWDEDDFDPSADPITNPPLASKDAPEILLDNGEEPPATSVAPVAVDGEVTIELPNDEGHSWIVRCVVNGGLSALADGRVVVDRSLIHERMVVIRDAGGRRPIVATETSQYDRIHGWAPEVGEAGAVGATGPTGPTGPAGASSAAKQIRREVYYADGSCELYDEDNVLVSTETKSTWGLQADGNSYRVWLVPGGTGGTRAPRTTTAFTCSGPGGCGGGAVFDRVFSRLELAAYIAALGTDIPVIVGAGGPGAPAGTLGVGTQDGELGTLGGATAFGELGAAFPGGRGQFGAVNGTGSMDGGGGGGWMSAGADGSSLADNTALGGAPLGGSFVSTSWGDNNFGGGMGDTGGSNTIAGAAGCSIYGGGGGGGIVNSGIASRPGGRSLFGVPGSGSGGSSSAPSTPRDGGDAGGRGPNPLASQSPQRQTGGGPPGGVGAVNADGGDGGDGADGILGLMPGESGAGGGGTTINNTSTGDTISGRGGDGGFPGGSGGASGVAKNSSSSHQTRANRGGHGADGVAVVFTYG